MKPAVPISREPRIGQDSPIVYHKDTQHFARNRNGGLGLQQTKGAVPLLRREKTRTKLRFLLWRLANPGEGILQEFIRLICYSATGLNGMSLIQHRVRRDARSEEYNKESLLEYLPVNLLVIGLQTGDKCVYPSCNKAGAQDTSYVEAYRLRRGRWVDYLTHSSHRQVGFASL